MFVERPPFLYRLLFPGAVWRLPVEGRKTVYLTFDDGPVPEVTPIVLDILCRHGIKATFFVVGDNVSRYPALFDEIRRSGHSFGNHTMHHLQGVETGVAEYMNDISEARKLVPSDLFRPPHGLIKFSQIRVLKDDFTLVMHDVVTRDYNRRFTPQRIFKNVRDNVRDGSIIVFHDSLKARENVLGALEPSIVWLRQQGYEFRSIPMHQRS